MKMNRLTTQIGIAMLLGVIVGYLCNTQAASPAAAKEIASYFGILTDVFLRLIKMIIAPLVFATLVAGLAGMGDSKTVGRIGAKALGWFVAASLCSLALGLLFANLLQPGANLGVPLPELGSAVGLKTSALNLKDFITHVSRRISSRRWRPMKSCRSSSSPSSSAWRSATCTTRRPAAWYAPWKKSSMSCSRSPTT